MMARQLGLDLCPSPRIPAALSSFHVHGQEMTPAQALAGEDRARTQEAMVLALIRATDARYPGARVTPSEIHSAFEWWPVTSVRRCLTNLTTKGQLVHHEKDRRPGPLGSAETTWSLAP